MSKVTRSELYTVGGGKVRTHLSYRGKRELVQQIASCYREASATLKTIILDESVTPTGYAREYAIRLLRHPVVLQLPIQRPRQPYYPPEVQYALVLLWTTANTKAKVQLTLSPFS